MTPVVLRTGRGALLLVLAAVGFLEVGLVAGLVSALRSGQVDTLWGLVGLLALVLGVAIVALVPHLVHPTTTTLSLEGYRVTRRGSVVLDIPRETLTGVVLRPALQATWQRTDAGDPSVRGVGRDRLHNRIELRSPAATVQLDDGRRWREQVAIVREWVRHDPSLVDDETTRALLGEHSAALPHSPRRPAWPLGLVRLAIRERDPWAPFLPDAYGEYSAAWGGRFTAARAPERGGRAGLLLRWGFLLLMFVPVVVLVWVLVTLVLAILQARAALLPESDDALQPHAVRQVVVDDQRR